MYYIFRTEINSWHKSIIQAWPYEDIPYNLIKPHWWFARPLIAPLPQLKFVLNPNAPFPDNFFTGSDLDLYSSRFIKLLGDNEIKFETFPAAMIDWKSGKELSVKYELFHLLEMHTAFNLNLSVIENNGSVIKKLVLTEECLKSGKLLFRSREKKSFILIHQNLKTILEHSNITGCTYIPVDEYQLL